MLDLTALLPRETASVSETLALGAELAAFVEPGDVIALCGDVGAGKTHLAKGVARGLGVDPDEVSSPTFTLIQEYEGQLNGALLPLYHFDLYRLEGPEALRAIGGEEYLWDDGVCLVEWPERASALLPPHTCWLQVSHLAADRRNVEQRDQPLV